VTYSVPLAATGLEWDRLDRRTVDRTFFVFPGARTCSSRRSVATFVVGRRFCGWSYGPGEGVVGKLRTTRLFPSTSTAERSATDTRRKPSSF